MGKFIDATSLEGKENLKDAQQRILEVDAMREAQQVAAIARKFLEKRDMSIKDFAELMGISRPLMSQYLSGKYNSDTSSLEKQIKEFLKREGFLGEGSTTPIKKAPFLSSEDALSILGICSSCQEQAAFGVVVGQSGFGKTYALQKYAAKDKVAYVECDDSMGTKDMVDAIERAIGLPYVFASIWNRVNTMKEFFNVNHGYLVVLDEADKLISKGSQKKAEILRSMFDQSPVGVIMAGEPSLEGRIRGYIPRLANRVDFFYKLNGITRDEVRKYLSDFSFTEEAFEEMYRRAANSKTGCFRLLDRTTRNIRRVMDNMDDSDAVVTLGVINKASNMMML